MDSYEEQAQNFLDKTGVTLTIDFKEHAPYFDEKTPRDIYQFTFKRGSRSYTYTFGQSIINSMKYRDRQTKTIWHCDGTSQNGMKKMELSFLDRFCILITERVYDELEGKYKTMVKRKAPNCYDILSCLEKYDPINFENFCGEYGYDTDSRKAFKVYKSVKKQYQNLCMLFSEEELEELAEIQ